MLTKFNFLLILKNTPKQTFSLKQFKKTFINYQLAEILFVNSKPISNSIYAIKQNISEKTNLTYQNIYFTILFGD